MNNPPEKYMICFGNPVDGFEYVGTFETYDLAMDYALDSSDDGDYWIILLQEPATDSLDEHQETQEWLNAPMGEMEKQNETH